VDGREKETAFLNPERIIAFFEKVIIARFRDMKSDPQIIYIASEVAHIYEAVNLTSRH
jgi:hypothetical protein